MEANKNTSKALYLFFLTFSLALIAAGFLTGPVNEMFKGFWAILTSPQSLTVDALQVGGLNGGLFQAGMLGLIAIAILKCAKVEASGITIGAFFLTIGFSFFGKNLGYITTAALADRADVNCFEDALLVAHPLVKESDSLGQVATFLPCSPARRFEKNLLGPVLNGDISTER